MDRLTGSEGGLFQVSGGAGSQGGGLFSGSLHDAEANNLMRPGYSRGARPGESNSATQNASPDRAMAVTQVSSVNASSVPELFGLQPSVALARPTEELIAPVELVGGAGDDSVDSGSARGDTPGAQAGFSEAAAPGAPRSLDTEQPASNRATLQTGAPVVAPGQDDAAERNAANGNTSPIGEASSPAAGQPGALYVDPAQANSGSVANASTADASIANASLADPFTVGDVNEAPTGLTLSAATVAENAAGASIGTLTVTDPDAGASHSFSVSDSRFEVAGGVLRLRAGESLNHETEPSVSVAVTATDQGGLSRTQTFSLTVSDVNEAPTGLTLSAATVAENSAGAAIGTLTVSDPDAGASHSFSVSDSRFEVAGGVLRLRAGESLNHETEPSVSVAVTATDQGGLSRTETFSLTVGDVNEAPTALTLSAATVAENSAGAAIGTLTVSDPDAGASHSFSVSDSRFEVAGGVLRLRAGESLNHETEPSVSVAVTATDQGGLSRTETFSLTVSDVNEAPTGLTLSAATVAENAAGASIGTLTVSDPDAGASHSFSVSDSRFEVAGGVLRLRAGESLNHETEPSVSVAVTATDQGGLSRTETFSLTVSDVNEAPTGLTLSAATVAENSAGAAIGTLTVSDPDAGASHSFSVSDSRFEVADGVLRLRAGESLNHETQPSVSVAVTATDQGGLSRTQTFSLTVSDVAEGAPGVTLSGNGGDNILVGGNRDDVLRGNGGNDLVFGGAGQDSVDGGTGNDMLFGGSGNDTLVGSDGADQLYGGIFSTGNDSLDGGNGDDSLYGGGGQDTLLGGAGNDQLYAGFDSSDGHNLLDGGTGNDSIYGGAGGDTASGGDGADQLYGGDAGNDSLSGGSGIDSIYGGDGNDILSGGGDADNVYGGTGADTISGDAGIDTLYGGTGNDSLSGGDSNDIIYGGDDDDTIAGGLGGDHLYGGDGSDRFVRGTGDGNDTVEAGSGGGWTDTIVLQSADGSALGDSGWTLSLTSGSVVSNIGGLVTLSQDASGEIVFLNGDTMDFTGIERIDY